MPARRNEIERIDGKRARQVTFYKRNSGLIKKAHQLSVLCDVDVLLVTWSPSGRLLVFSNTAHENVAKRYHEHRGQRQVITSKLLRKKQAARDGLVESDDEDEGNSVEVDLPASAGGTVTLPYCESGIKPVTTMGALSFVETPCVTNSAYFQRYGEQTLHTSNFNPLQGERPSEFSKRVPHVADHVNYLPQSGSGSSYLTGAQQNCSPAYLRNYEAAAAALFGRQRSSSAMQREGSSSSRGYMASFQGQPSAHLSALPTVPFLSRQYQVFDAAQASYSMPVSRHPVPREHGYASRYQMAPAAPFDAPRGGHWQYLG